MSVTVKAEMVTALRSLKHEELLDSMTAAATRYGANAKAARIDRIALRHRLEQLDRRGEGPLPEYAVRLIADALDYGPSALADLPDESPPLRKVRLIASLIDRVGLAPENRTPAIRRQLEQMATARE